MERDLTDASLDAIAFLTGATLSAMLGRMQWRVDRATGGVSGYLLLWALGFVWTFGNFLRCVLELAGVSADTASVKFAESFAWSCTLLGPLAIGRLVQGAIGTESRASRSFFGFTLAVSLLNLVLMARANYVYGFRVEASAYPTTSFFMALAVGIAAVLVYWKHRADVPTRRTMPRWFAPVALSFAVIHTSAILFSTLFPDMPDALMTTLSLIGRHWIIPWSILIAVSLAQAHYADVIAKRSLWLLASVTVATLIGMQVASPAGLSLLATTLVIAALMLVSPLLIRGLDALVDQVVLDRPDYSRASKVLSDDLRRAASPQALIDTALESVRTTLRVGARWNERIEVTTSHEARTLMQPELAFLDSVRTQLAHRLESWHLEEQQRALHLREERLRRLLTEAELKALRTQVDPHFLFNTLNTIADLISANPEQAERMTERLAECFRYALAKHSRDLSTLDEELGFARQYLGIEQVRFGERLRVEFSRGDATGAEAIPSLLLQPLLENAIRHGLAPLREGGNVSVRAQRDGAGLRILIEDDGAGAPRGYDRSGVGLSNVQERLTTLYGAAAEFLIGARPDGRGTLVNILIPPCPSAR